MKLTPINQFLNSSCNSKNNVLFNGKKTESKISKDDDGKEYVKVPKSDYNLNKLAWGVLIAIDVIALIHFFVTKKPEPWETSLKELKNAKNLDIIDVPISNINKLGSEISDPNKLHEESTKAALKDIIKQD